MSPPPMSSGVPGDADFYSSVRTSVGSPATAIGNAQLGYRPQLGGILWDSSTPIVKRSLGEIGTQQHLQQQQQLGVGGFLRSVKQRSNHHHVSPMSTLSPVDFSTTVSPEMPVSTASVPTLSGRYGNPLFQHLRPQKISFSPNNYAHVTPYNPSFPGFSYSEFVPNPQTVIESEPDLAKKMRNRLQELEKQLLDDDDNEEDEGDAASVITSSEWSETIQSLIIPTTPKPLSPSPTTSSSSSSSSSASPSSGCSLQSLMDAAVLISEGKIDAVTAILDRLKQISNTQGDPEKRLTAYMVSSLQSRIMTPTENPSATTELCTEEQMVATQMLYEASPCFKLGFMAANLAIIEAMRDPPTNNVLHVVDFDIGQGSQYFTLIHALAALAQPQQSDKHSVTVVKITAINDSSNNNNNKEDDEEERLRIVGERLRKHAERVGMRLKFKVMSSKISDLNRDVLGCDSDEVLAVNFVFQLYRMPDESVSTENARDALLRLVKGLAPRVVTLVEQEMNANTAPFVARVTEACSFYRAMFDSLDATMTRDSAERVRMEECMGRKAANSVACEGRDRIERCEVFGKWRARMGMAGFKPRPLGQNVAEWLRNRLASGYRNNPGFTIKEEAGGICFGWMGRVLTVASAWS